MRSSESYPLGWNQKVELRFWLLGSGWRRLSNPLSLKLNWSKNTLNEWEDALFPYCSPSLGGSGEAFDSLLGSSQDNHLCLKSMVSLTFLLWVPHVYRTVIPGLTLYKRCSNHTFGVIKVVVWYVACTRQRLQRQKQTPFCAHPLQMKCEVGQQRRRDHKNGWYLILMIDDVPNSSFVTPSKRNGEHFWSGPVSP